MLFPTDPKKRPELWSEFAEKITAGAIRLVVHRGEVLRDENQVPYMGEGKRSSYVINSFVSADIVRFGADGGQALGPFFALRVVDGVGHLVEYAIDACLQSNTERSTQEALQSLAINILFENKEIREINLPFVCSKWDISEWKASIREDRTILRRVT